MSKTELQANLDARAHLFKALGHPVRLLIVNLVHMKPRHGEELAEILNLSPATISHHLSQLTSAGLLALKKDQYYHTYSLTGDVIDRTLDEIIRLPQAELTADVKEDAYRNKVLRSFFKRGRLTQIPRQFKKQQIVLEKIVEEFEPGREYPEHEVNQILLEFHEDVAALRRGLIEHDLMERDKGIYWRSVETSED
jgi:DNA-binding transcriptional ArsR family regulator